MIEVEVKYRLACEELKTVERKLEELGFKFVIEKLEEDLYFNSPVRDFGKSDEALRLRRDNEGVKLTYKGRKLDSTTKTREELTVNVSDFEEMKKILGRLGFVPVGKVRKKRKVYRQGDVVACLDVVEELGCFIEFEIDVEDPKEVENSKCRLAEIASKMGVEGSITKSYLEMLIF